MTRDELRQIGVIVGSGGGSQEFTEEQYRLYYSGKQKQCSVYTIPTSTIGTLASEVSMRFGFRGMSHIVSTGCTSSTDAIGYAYRNIQAGVLDMMVAGGVDAPIAPLILRGFIADAHHEHELERGAGARFAAFFARPRRLRDRGGRLVLRDGGAGARARPRRAYLRRNRRVRIHLRSLSPRAPGRVRRRAGAHHADGDGGGRHRARATCSTSTITAPPRS